ncbi:hypothetical protein [Flavobacterium sp.]|uniref:hypothetical protein n=1 Tax=Flavobacterium sp. TaxID=239 RepID=UPI003753728C
MKKSQKEIEDSVILQNVIDALGVRIPEFRTKIGYSTNTTIYNVLHGVNGISIDMINRIITKYPEVSYLYLKKGVGEPIRIGPAVTNQKNILGLYEKDDFVNIHDFLKLPGIVEELRKKVNDFEKKVNDLEKEIKDLKKGAN